jgi:hypothetical protein
MTLSSEFRVMMGYDFRKKIMYGSALLPVICRRTHVVFT